MLDDLTIARKYVNKANSAASKGLEFDLTFAEFKSLFKRKRCAFSGVELTDVDGGPAATDRTIDRIDNTKGYVSGNVVASCFFANQFRSLWEDGQNPLTLSYALAITHNSKRLLES
jgi:hypothetical protein